MAERLRHLTVDQDYASSNLVDPAELSDCWRGRADRGASLLKRFTRVQILPPALALEALMAKHWFLKPGRRVRVPTSASKELRIGRSAVLNPQLDGSGSSIGRAAGLYPAGIRSVRDPSSSLGRSMRILDWGFWILDCRRTPLVQNRKSKI